MEETSWPKSIKEGQGTEEVNTEILGETWVPKGEGPEAGVRYGSQVKDGQIQIPE